MSATSNYDILREWHLARIRNLARMEAEKTSATPSSLIASDKEAIRALIDSAAKPDSAPDKRSIVRPMYLVFAWLAVQAVVAAVIISKQGTTYGTRGFLESTIGALNIFHADPVSMGSLEKLAFLCFYFLPPLILAFTPARIFFSPDSRLHPLAALVRYPRGEWLVTGATVVALALQAFVIYSGAQETAAPASLDLVPTGPSHEQLPARALLAWSSLVITVLTLYSKRLAAVNNWAQAQAQRLADQCAPAESSPSSTADLADGLTLLANTVDELQQREHAIADFSDRVLICFDEELAIQAISPSVLIQWGYFQHDLLGQHLRSFVFRDDQENLWQGIKNSPRTKPIELHSRVTRSDNSVLDCAWFIDWSPRYGRFFAACADVTDRMNLERTRRAFMAQLTHDMRSPLSAVNLTLSAMQECTFGELSPEAQRVVMRSKDSLTRVLDLINEILDSEKLRSGQHKLQSESFRLADLCETIVAELGPISLQRKVTFQLSGLEQTASGDRRLIARVLTNILSNAVSFSPKGGQVELSCTPSADSLVIKIRDHGPGIPRDYQQLVFERFGLAKRRDPGDRVSTGLGLSICRDIVTAHGGMIGIESEEGHGSTFWFTLARAKESS